MSKRGLGKGLDALLATSHLAQEKQQAASTDNKLMNMPISKLKPGTYQPRKDMSPEALEELSSSIQSQGIIQPIIIRMTDEGEYEIIAGERRWRAAKQAGLKQVPCLIKNVEDRAAIAMALIENIQREDLNSIEEAQALERLQNEFNLTHQQVADAIGKSRTTVSNLLRLNQLTDSVKLFVESKQLEMGHARALLMLDNEQQYKVAQHVIKKNLTVRQTEELVKKALSDNPLLDIKPKFNDIEKEKAQIISNRLSSLLGSKVSVSQAKNGVTKMTVNIDELSKLEQLIAKLEAL